MWRLARFRGPASACSPWFFEMLVRHLADSCFVAERQGVIEAYVVASLRRGGRIVHLFDSAFDPELEPEDQYLLLGELLRIPHFHKARAIEVSPAWGGVQGLGVDPAPSRVRLRAAADDAALAASAGEDHWEVATSA
jgi:hypothetical protein